MNPSDHVLVERIRRRAAAGVDYERVLAAYQTIRQSLSTIEFERAVRDWSVENLMREVLSDRAIDPAFQGLRAHIDRTVADSARLYSGDLPARFRVGAFNPYDPAIAGTLTKLSTRVVRDMKAQVRETVVQYVTEGMVKGQNPRTIARGVRNVVGLSPRQEEAVRRFREQLEAGDRSALRRALGRNRLRNTAGDELTRRGHAGGFGLNDKQLAMLRAKLGTEKLDAKTIDKFVEQYRKRALAWNAETQARTMALDAQRLAQRLSWEDAIAKGVVERDRLRRTWITVGDSRVRDEHAEMEGEEVGFDDTYSNGEQVPGDSTYNCRCVERFSVAPPDKDSPVNVGVAA